MHTVVFGWFGVSALWLVPLALRLAIGAFLRNAPARGRGTIRLWLGFAGVFVGSGALEAALVPQTGNALGHALLGVALRVLGRGAFFALPILVLAGLPWLLGFSWRGALRWADRAFGLGFNIGPGAAASGAAASARKEEPRSARVGTTGSVIRTTPPNAMAPKSTGRYARPTVWQPPATTSAKARSGAPVTPVTPSAPRGALRDARGLNAKAFEPAAALRPPAHVPARNVPERSQSETSGARPSAISAVPNLSTVPPARHRPLPGAFDATGRSGAPAVTPHPAAPAASGDAAGAGAPQVTAQRSPASAFSSTSAPGANPARPQPVGRTYAAQTDTARRATPPAETSPGVLETLRAIEANAAQWTALASSSLARRGAAAALPQDIAGANASSAAPGAAATTGTQIVANEAAPATAPAARQGETVPTEPAPVKQSDDAAIDSAPANDEPAPRATDIAAAQSQAFDTRREADAYSDEAADVASAQPWADDEDPLDESAGPAWAIGAAPARRVEPNESAAGAQRVETNERPTAAQQAAPNEGAAAAQQVKADESPAAAQHAESNESAAPPTSAPPFAHASPGVAPVPSAMTAAPISTAAPAAIPSIPSIPSVPVAPVLLEIASAPKLDPQPPTTTPAPAAPWATSAAPLTPAPASSIAPVSPASAPAQPAAAALAPTLADAESAARPPLRGHAAAEFTFHAPAASAVELPSLDLLEPASSETEEIPAERLAQTGQLIEQRLQEFKVPVTVVGASAGPVITRFEIEPALGVRGSQIVGLMKDLSRGLGLTSIRVVETIPGKTCMGLELPNAKRQTIRLSEILAAAPYRHSVSKLTIAMGKDITGQPIVTDLAKAPHMLVAGTTGSGKSVAINAMIVSLLFKATPEEVRLIMIDPKMLELSVYEGIPHLLAPVVTDMKLAANALNWCVGEMEKRYRLMSAVGVRNLAGFNQKLRDAQAAGKKIGNPFSLTPDAPEPLSPLPLIVVVIDELADLMMVAGKKIEELIARLAQKARAAGIHLILATQRPSVDVITGLIKANIPTRVAFQVSSKIDSRTILDQMGAESLLGQGDMLFLPPGTGYPQRVHGAFVADEEVHRVVEHLKQFGEPQYEEGILDGPATEGAAQDLFGDAPDAEADPLYDEAVAFVVRTRRASISAVQRQLRIGYNRAARLVEQMEAAGLVSSMGVNGSREVIAPPSSEP